MRTLVHEVAPHDPIERLAKRQRRKPPAARGGGGERVVVGVGVGVGVGSLRLSLRPASLFAPVAPRDSRLGVAGRSVVARGERERVEQRRLEVGERDGFRAELGGEQPAQPDARAELEHALPPHERGVREEDIGKHGRRAPQLRADAAAERELAHAHAHDVVVPRPSVRTRRRRKPEREFPHGRHHPRRVRARRARRLERVAQRRVRLSSARVG